MGFWNALFGGGESDEEKTEESTVEPGAEEESRAGEIERVEIEAPERFWATVLYPFPVDLDRAGLEELLDDAGLEWEEIEIGRGGRFRVVFAETSFVLEQRDEPYPAAETDRRLLPETFPDDYANVGVAPEAADPLQKRDMLREPGAYPDPWDESGVARRLTRLVRGLLSMDATAVVLNLANGLAVPSQQFLDFTEGVEEGEPGAAFGWLDVRDDEGTLRADGLEIFGLPDLTIRVEHGDDWWRDRRKAGVLEYALSTMLRENRLLGAGSGSEAFAGFEPIEEFRVPIAADTGTVPDELDGDVDVTPFRVELEEGRLVFTSTGPSTVWETWASIDDEGVSITAPAYREVLRDACREELGVPLGTVEFGAIEGLEEVECDLYQSHEAGPVHFVTAGLGRRARRASSRDGRKVRVELAARAAEATDGVIEVLENCAAGFELGDGSWEVGEILEFEAPLHNLQTFVLAQLVEAVPAEGPTIEIWQLVPLTGEEYEELSEEGDATAWLEEHDGATGREFAERWNATGA